MSKSKRHQPLPVLVLNYNEFNSWQEKIKVFLMASKNRMLHELKQQQKRDGSASLEVLAGIRVINCVLPCPVELHQMDSFKLLCFRLGKGSFEFTVQKDKELLKSIVNSGANVLWNMTFDPKNQNVWLVIPKGKPLELNFPYSTMLRALDYMITVEKKRLSEIRQQKLNEIGFRPIKLHTPSGKPDIRIQSVPRMTDGQFNQLKPQDLVNDMKQYSCLLENCPDGIDEVMQRARLLYVNAYHEWEFFTMSIHYAVLALEASLRAIYDEWLGTENVEVTATIQEKQCKPKITIIEMLSGPRDNIIKWSNRKKTYDVKVKGLLLPRNKSHLLDHAVKIDVLSMWEKEQCEHLLWLRDIFSHPTGTFTDWISWATKNIFESCLWINLMWARFSRKLPYEFAWEKIND